MFLKIVKRQALYLNTNGGNYLFGRKLLGKIDPNHFCEQNLSKHSFSGEITLCN